MPMPSSVQAAANPARLVANAISTSPAANTKLVAARTSRPPKRSIIRPASGPSKPDSSNAPEKMPKYQSREMCSAAETGSAKIAVR